MFADLGLLNFLNICICVALVLISRTLILFNKRLDIYLNIYKDRLDLCRQQFDSQDLKLDRLNAILFEMKDYHRGLKLDQKEILVSIHNIELAFKMEFKEFKNTVNSRLDNLEKKKH